MLRILLSFVRHWNMVPQKDNVNKILNEIQKDGQTFFDNDLLRTYFFFKDRLTNICIFFFPYLLLILIKYFSYHMRLSIKIKISGITYLLLLLLLFIIINSNKGRSTLKSPAIDRLTALKIYNNYLYVVFLHYINYNIY